MYLDNCISAGGKMGDKINSRIVKSEAAHANLDHFWHLRGVSLAVKSRIYNVLRIPRRTLFADTGSGWKKRSGGQHMTWCRGMVESCTGLASVGPS
ncbi:unnamed protein product [Schistosoma mattheei]|uniref:Uncharacterized protein n=1 Tax=Schistosoma mattheei TaxID=31246 RepID=A0A183PVZ2_9TREM|nr:unnamed protein product [Schistosoma mattheei]